MGKGQNTQRTLYDISYNKQLPLERSSVQYKTVMRTFRRGRPGFLLLETLVGLALFALFVTGVGLALLASSESGSGAGDRLRAITLSEKALEGARTMRDTQFTSLTAGSHGMRIGSGAAVHWMVGGASNPPDT